MDEPDRKATFEISIIALDNQIALSNMVGFGPFFPRNWSFAFLLKTFGLRKLALASSSSKFFGSTEEWAL